MKPLGALIALVSLALVLALVLWEMGERTSPGPLHPVHAQVPGLAGGQGCARCHAAGGGSGPGGALRCADCHAGIATQLRERRGLHGGLLPALAADCAQCHREHSGAAIEPVGAAAFAAAGVPDRDRYDHRHTGLDLGGRHLVLGCADCHPHADTEVLPAGERRFLGLSRRCASCHQDVHGGAFGDGCADCHGQDEPFARAPRFRHAADFPLRDAHGRTACAACHPATGAYSVAALRSDPRPARGCAACHAEVHAAPDAALPFRRARDCALCHGTRAFAPATLGADRHGEVGPELSGAHARLGCADCHARGGPAGAALPADLRDCAACHESPHRRELLAAAACARCHDAGDASFALPEAEMPRELHAAAGMELLPPHGEVACAGCHAPAPAAPAAERFRTRHPGRDPLDCAACHGDPHGGQLRGGATGGRCTACHAAERFTPSTFAVEEHARTAMPLLGAHRAVPCGACHPAGTDGMPRFRPRPTACAGCHEDPHGAAFAGTPAAGAGRRDCALCHDAVDFAHAAAAFDHARWTGHALAGAHRGVACGRCHERAARPGARRATYDRPSRDCAACHADVHRGQFRVGGRTDCARCHTEDGFDRLRLRFDHARDSRFPLDERHARLPCSSCHRAWTAADGAQVVRYKPLGTVCRDCHGTAPRRGGGG